MANKKQYYKLDDVGFVGTQEKRTKAEIKKDIDMTIEYIKAKNNAHYPISSKKCKPVGLNNKQYVRLLVSIRATGKGNRANINPPLWQAMNQHTIRRIACLIFNIDFSTNCTTII